MWRVQSLKLRQRRHVGHCAMWRKQACYELSGSQTKTRDMSIGQVYCWGDLYEGAFERRDGFMKSVGWGKEPMFWRHFVGSTFRCNSLARKKILLSTNMNITTTNSLNVGSSLKALLPTYAHLTISKIHWIMPSTSIFCQHHLACITSAIPET